MKKNAIVAVLALAGMAIPALAQQQHQTEPSLGDLARQVRSQEKPHATMVFDNDNLPKSGTINIMGEAAPDDKTKKDDKTAEAGKKPEAGDDAAKRVEAQKKVVDDLKREIDLMQREHTLRLALNANNPGARLREDKTFADAEAKYSTDLADRQKKLADAEKALSDLESQTKAGQ